MEQDDVDDRKNHRVRSNAQGQRQSGDYEEYRAFDQTTPGVPQILESVIEPWNRALLAVQFFGLLDAAIHAPRRRAGIVRAQAGAPEVVFKQPQVRFDLARHLAFGAPPEEDIPDLSGDPTHRGQHQNSSESSFSTNPASCRHRCVSSSSAFSPERVSE